jgi:hypothetical protein
MQHLSTDVVHGNSNAKWVTPWQPSKFDCAFLLCHVRSRMWSSNFRWVQMVSVGFFFVGLLGPLVEFLLSTCRMKGWKETEKSQMDPHWIYSALWRLRPYSTWWFPNIGHTDHTVDFCKGNYDNYVNPWPRTAVPCTCSSPAAKCGTCWSSAGWIGSPVYYAESFNIRRSW